MPVGRYNGNVDFAKVISELRKQYDAKKGSFTKKELQFLTGRDTLRGRLLGFLTAAYYRRPRLFREGRVTYALAFRKWTGMERSERLLSTWVLFSPSSEFDAHPDLLYKVKANLDALVENGEKNRKLHKLYVALTEELSEPAYMEIPKEFSEGKLVYLSFIYLRNHQIPKFRLGINLIVMDRSVSKEVLYLPALYWSTDFVNYYYRKKV